MKHRFKINLKRIGAVLLAFAMLTGGLPILAAEDNWETIDVSKWPYYIQHLSEPGNYRIVGKAPGARIVADARKGTINILLDGVGLSTDTDGSNPALLAKGGTVNLILKDGSSNEFDCNGLSGIWSYMDGKLNIQAEGGGTPGKLTMKNTKGIQVWEDSSLDIQDGNLDIQANSTAAAIGSEEGKQSGSIVISGGQITVDNPVAAAIGNGQAGLGADVSITGGTVRATSRESAAIGNSAGGVNSHVTITGGEVFADGAVGIGSFGSDSQGAVEIQGGRIQANGSCAGIGCAKPDDSSAYISNLIFTGGDVRASGTGGIQNGIQWTIKNGAVVHASSVKGADCQNGVVYLGSDAYGYEGKIAGTFQPAAEFVIAENETLTVEKDGTFNSSFPLTNCGTLINYGQINALGGLENQGRYRNKMDGVTVIKNGFAQGAGGSFEDQGLIHWLLDLKKGNVAIGNDSFQAEGNTVNGLSGLFELYQSERAMATGNTVSVNCDTDTDIILNGINVKAASGEHAPFEIAEGTSGTVTVTLADGSKNELLSNAEALPALAKTITQGNETVGKLMIRCAHSGEEGHQCQKDVCGRLELTTGASVKAATLGSAPGEQRQTGNIEISGGNLEATSNGTGAAIGGGEYASLDGLTVTGGNIEAATINNSGSAAIGSGIGAMIPAGRISIQGGTVNASVGKNSLGAAIGQSAGEVRAKDIEISGGSVQAAGVKGPAIGNAETVSITGGEVEVASQETYALVAGNLTLGGTCKVVANGSGSRKGIYAESGAMDGGCLVYAPTTPEGLTLTKGILFIGANGTAYGTAVLNQNTEISYGQCLEIPSGAYLVVPKNVTLTNKGSITGNGGFVPAGKMTGNQPEGSLQTVLDPAYGYIGYIQNGCYYESNWFPPSSKFVIKNVGGGTVDVQISIYPNETAELRLGGVTIDVRGMKEPAIQVRRGSKVRLVLEEGTVNTLYGGAHCAGIEQEGTSTIEILCEHTGEGHVCDGNCGILNVYGGKDGGAGIGGYPSAKLIVSGGNIKAAGGIGGAGIGGSNWQLNGDIAVKGGNVSASGTNGAAGIGRGAGAEETYETAGTIEISGGQVSAAGAPGIDKNLSTGEAGNAVLFTDSFGDDPLADTLRGLIFRGTAGQLYGDLFAVKGDLTVERGQTLTIGDGQTLEVPDGAALTNYGTIVVKTGGTLQKQELGTIINNGQITAEEGAVIPADDEMLSYGKLDLSSMKGSLTIRENHYTFQGEGTTESIETTYEHDYQMECSGDAAETTITVASGVKTIRFYQANIKPTTGYALTVKSGAVLNLILDGETMFGGGGILVEEGAMLNISCAESFGCSEENCTNRLKTVLDGEGSVTLNGGLLDLSGQSAPVSNALTVNAGTLELRSGEISGDLTAAGGRLNVNKISGSFRTDGAGSPVVVAETIMDQRYRQESIRTRGLIFEGNKGVVFGPVSLGSTLNIPAGATLLIPGDGILYLSQGQMINEGVIQNYGRIYNTELIQNQNGGRIDELSALELTVLNGADESVETARYDDNLTLRATIHKIEDVQSMALLADDSEPAPDTVQFYIGGQLIAAQPIMRNSDGTFTAELPYTVKAVPSTDPYEITAAYGGTEDSGSENEGLLSQTGSAELTVTEGKLSGITAEGFTGVYDRKEHRITVNGAEDCTLKFGEAADDMSYIASPSYRDAGEYRVYYSAEKPYYEPFKGEMTISITPKPIDVISGIQLPDVEKGSASTFRLEKTSVFSQDIIMGDTVTASGTVVLSGTDQAGDYQDGTFLIQSLNTRNYRYTGSELVTGLTYRVTEPGLELSEDKVTLNGIRQDCTLILASRQNGTLLNIRMIPISETENGTDILIADTGLKLEGADQVTAMLWEDLSSMRPLCEAKSVTLSYKI